eukprot:g39038.t1
MLKWQDPPQKEIQCWSEAVEDHLWDCLESVDWTQWKTYTRTVMDFISKCVEDCGPKKSIWLFPNQKPWMNQEIHSLLKTRHAAFKLGDLDRYRKSRYDLGKTIRNALKQYRT